MDELTIKSLSAVMTVSARGRSRTVDELLGIALEESLKALDDVALGWICLVYEPPDDLIGPAVTARPQRSVRLTAIKHAGMTAPEAATIVCSDCPCLRAVAGADPSPNDSVTDQCPQPVLSELAAGARACIPLFAQERPIGVLNLAKARSTSFSASELLFLQTIASQVSIALENTRLIGETQVRLQETQTLLEVSHSVNSTLDLQEAVRRIARAIGRAITADTVGAYLQDASTGDLFPFAGYHLPKNRLTIFSETRLPLRGNRFLEDAWEAKSAVYTSDTSNDPRCTHEIFHSLPHRSILFVPMLVKDQAVGGLLAIWWEAQHQFIKAEVRLVDAIARQTAIAIGNAKLFEEAQRHAQALEISEEKYRLLAEHVQDVIYALDAEGRFSYVNPRVKEVLGYTPTELLGRYCTDILAPESRHRAQAIFARAVKGKDPFNFYELEMVKEDGSGFVLVEVGTVTIRDAAGRVTGWQGVARDITERKQLEQRLLHAERLRALGEMASGVAHDFNNVLTAILGRSQIMRQTVQDMEAKRGLEAIEKAALDGANMVSRLQHFNRQRRKEEFFPADLNQIVKDALAITEVKWKDEANFASATIDLVASYGKISSILGNVSELREVLTNLIFNAVEAMPRGGQLTVKTKEVEGWVCASVSDTGMGMTEEVKARIFDPFFTTKGIKGTGLGLSVSYGIIKGHHGEIDVQSQPGQGTTMLVRLPMSSELRSAPESKSTPTPKPGRILVIDDDELVRELLSDVLQADGHAVVQAAGGREGLRLFRQGGFDLVLTDLGMPECSGWEVAAAIKKIAPRIPVALITGWGLTLDREKLKEAGVDLLLNKPFQVGGVRGLVAEALTLCEKI